MGKCEKCGVENLKWSSKEISGGLQATIKWDTFEYVELELEAQLERQ